jgi:hypothetical protein
MASSAITLALVDGDVQGIVAADAERRNGVDKRACDVAGGWKKRNNNQPPGRRNNTIFVPNKEGGVGGTGAWARQLSPWTFEDQDERARLPAVIDAADSKDARGRGWLNPMSLELLSRFLHNQSTQSIGE